MTVLLVTAASLARRLTHSASGQQFKFELHSSGCEIGVKGEAVAHGVSS
jgi:hypothetical protein